MSEKSMDELTEEWIPHEQRWRACDGHMEREPGRLQLRVALRGQEGVCSVLFEEDATTVPVLILVCGDGDPEDEWIGCPVHIYLERPLGDRAVVDVAQGRRPVPYFNVYRALENKFKPDPAWFPTGPWRPRRDCEAGSPLDLSETSARREPGNGGGMPPE